MWPDEYPTTPITSSMTKDNIIGTYECTECNNAFEITHASNSAYDGWMPCCPECGLEDTVKQVNQ